MPHNVPIVGQPFKVLGGTAIATIECQCEGKRVLTVPMGAGATCPSCRRTYVVPQVDLPLRVVVGMTAEAEQVNADLKLVQRDVMSGNLKP